MQYHEAKYYCEQRGAHLVNSQSRTENSFLKERIGRLKGDAYWLGLNDLSVEGIWKWENSSAPIAFKDWAPGEPKSSQGENNDCAWFDNTRLYQWDDVPCTQKLNPLCEIYLLPPFKQFIRYCSAQDYFGR